MSGSLHIGKIAGIDLYIHISWFIILALLTLSLATAWFPASYPGISATSYLVLGLIAAILLFVSVLLHELGHSLVARARGLPANKIVLFIFGGISNIEEEPKNAGTEFLISFVGPLVSFVIGGIALLLYIPVSTNGTPLAPMLLYLGVANLLLGGFNLLPGYPLDGGRVLRAIVWKVTGNADKATRVAINVGQVVAYLFILGGVWVAFSGNFISGIWLGFIGWFLLSSAQTIRMQNEVITTFQGVRVEQIMRPINNTVPANISLQRLVDEYFLPNGLRAAIVVRGDDPAGLISLRDIGRVPRDTWSQTLVGMVMIPIEQLHTVSSQQLLTDVLPLMSKKDVNQLPVIDDGKLVGILSRDNIIQSLQIRQSLGLNKDRTA